MDSKSKLKRFCYLGSFEPIYIYLNGTIKVGKYWPIVEKLVKDVNDIEFLAIIKEILHEANLVRRDEVLFVYAAYLASSVDIQWKTAMRQAFPVLIHSDDDLFLFCKYASLIAKEQNRKGFTRTVRKAIVSWYEMQSTDTIRTMWLAHRGLHGFTHKALIKLCHVSDKTIGSTEVVTPFFKTCTELLADSNANESSIESAVKSKEILNKTETIRTTTAKQSVILAISKLRTTNNISDAKKIIRELKLSYAQVPGHLLRHRSIMEAVLPTMSYMQILKCWRKMARLCDLGNRKLQKICQNMLENKELAKQSNIHPVHFLMNLHDSSKNKQSDGQVNSVNLDYLEKLYKESFNWHEGSGNLRMHITLNLQRNYRRKFLKNHKNLMYYDACMALAYGYWKRETKVDVFHWYENKVKLKKIHFRKDHSLQLGFTSGEVENLKNHQRLITPILNALRSKQVYDVFLCIVPTAGRGNPKQSSELICTFLDKYRSTKNPNAKFIILTLLKFKRSMSYSETRSENILEICGLDEHTTNIIHNFITQRFE